MRGNFGVRRLVAAFLLGLVIVACAAQLKLWISTRPSRVMQRSQQELNRLPQSAHAAY